MRKPVADKLPIDADKLNARLTRHGVTVEQISAYLNVRYSTVLSWTLGGGQIDPVHLYKLSKLFHCPMTNFLPADFRKEGV